MTLRPKDRLRGGKHFAETPASRLAKALAPGKLEGAHAIADRIGVWRGLGNRALNGRKINASAHIQFCYALGIDPLSGKECPPRIVGPVLWWFFGAALILQRMGEGLSQREAAKAAGVNYMAVQRAETAEPLAIENYLALCRWLDAPAERFTANMDCDKRAEAA